MSDSWKAKIPIDDAMSAGELRRLTALMRAERGIDYQSYMSEGFLVAVIRPEHFWLSYNAPPGSHEFARGFIVAGAMLALAKMAKRSLDFQRIEYSNNRRVLKYEDDGIRMHQDGTFDYLVGIKDGNITIKVNEDYPTKLTPAAA